MRVGRGGMTKKKQPLKYKLDAYEQNLYDNFDNEKSIMTDELVYQLQEAARKHVGNRRSITIRVIERDLNAIKIKAAKKALPYQTYLNMLIHQDAIST